MITLYNVVSSDGFIARLDGSEDFIPDEVWDDFLDICKSYDTIVMGRKTYETIQAYPKEMIEKFEHQGIKKIIVTNNQKFVSKPEYTISHSPKEAFSLGRNVLLTSGPTLNSSVLKENLIDKVILNTLPSKIGTGIKIFDTSPRLSLISTVEKPGNRKLYLYNIIK
jgi:dihydrofolate reductase